MKKTIVVGISGGVDSAVSAYLLKKQGYEVIGVFMQNWDPYLNNQLNYVPNNLLNNCDVEYAFQTATKVCNQLDIKLYRVNFIKDYWKNVFVPFLKQYENGLTPNPDVLCNQLVKFGSFSSYCFKNFNCDYIATGHYANIKYDANKKCYLLLTAKDINKDQTYFLCMLNQKQLAKTIFPLANLLKSQVRKIAHENNLINWNQKDSTGICFIEEKHFKSFLQNYILPKEGYIKDIVTNQIVGKHNGVYYYTIGQNKNLNLGGFKNKYYVCNKDIKNNILYVVDKENQQKYLSFNQVIVNNFNWISYLPNNNQVELKFRHSPIKYKGSFELINNHQVIFKFDNVSAIALGQYLVAYQNNICLGGGIINKTFLTSQNN